MKAKIGLVFLVLGMLAGVSATGSVAVERDLVDARPTAQISIKQLGKGTLTYGETTRFSITANRSGFVQLYVKNASGRMQLWMENVPIRAGASLKYPIDRSVKIRAVAPFGNDEVLAVLTKHKVDGFAGRQVTATPMEVAMDAEEFEQELRAILTRDEKNLWVWTRTVVSVSE